MNHDVICDKYARLYEIPTGLAQLGNDIKSICTSYRPSSASDLSEIFPNGQITWCGLPTPNNRLLSIFMLFKVFNASKKVKPDTLLASSDCLQIILGSWIAKKLKTKFVADLYDDYETFGLAKIPFVKFLYRRALKRADLITCVSETLKQHVEKYYNTKARVIFLPSTINKNDFFPQDKLESRRKFSLPTDCKLIGTAGGLTKDKGIETVYNAMIRIADLRKDVKFVLAGPFDKSFPPPNHPQFIYLGKLPHKDISSFFCSLDVGIVPIQNTQYGRLSFPQKAYEMAACKIPMAVANVGDMKFIFENTNQSLFVADDNNDLAGKLLMQLDNPEINTIEIPYWDQVSRKLDTAIKDLF